MSVKDKILTFLGISKPEDTTEEEINTMLDPTREETSDTAAAENPISRSVLKLPSDHPFQRLYDFRRGQGGYLPLPELRMDENGLLPPEMIEKEKKRLQTALKIVCGPRLKQARDWERAQKQKTKQEEEEPLDMDALPCFFLSADKIYAWLVVLPPVGNGEELSREMLYRAMAEQGIVYGVDTELIDRLPMTRARYFNLSLMARGKEPFDGKNGNIIDYFPRVTERVFEVNEYDQVDYTALNLIHNIKQGQEICRLIRPTEGEAGRTVLDEEIPAKSGKTVPLPKGRNTEISEDGLLLLAKVDGHVEFTGRSFQVKPVLEIPGNVDYSTGDIWFLGDVNIHGDVLGGFSVRAMGNIHVSGVVEAGSTVESGGDLTVVRGILGDGSTTVRSHRSIFSKYIEGAVVSAKETLQTDCIIGSYVYCDGEIHVKSGRGRIMGGQVWAADKICVRAIGSSSECKTIIKLSGSPCGNFERESLQRQIHAIEMELEKLECQLESPIRDRLLAKAESQLAEAEQKLSLVTGDMEPDEDIEEEGETEKKVDTRCLEYSIAYPGTKIVFDNAVLCLQQASNHRTARLIDGEIVLR